MKKIVLVTGSLGIGGLEKILIMIADYFVLKKYKVNIVCLFGNKNHFNKNNLNPNINVKFFYFNKNKSYILKIYYWLKFLKSYFKTEKPEIIVCMALKIAALCSLTKNKCSKLVLREMSDPKSKVRSIIFDKICFFIIKKNINSIIFQTNWEKKCYPIYLQEKGKVIPNPCKPLIKKDVIRKKIIVTTGRLHNVSKRHDLLIKSFSKVFLRHPDYKLLIYGDGPDKKYDLNLIKKLNLKNKVFIIKPKNNVISYIIDSSCFVLASEFEGMSNSLLEAFLSGIPCISTNWHGVEDIMINYKNGLIVKRNSVDCLSSAINFIIENPNEATKYSINAKNQRKKYDIKFVLKKYYDIIKQ